VLGVFRASQVEEPAMMAMIFPNERAVLRVVSAIFMGFDEQGQAGRCYLPAESD
jgi:hypothetical protein